MPFGSIIVVGFSVIVFLIMGRLFAERRKFKAPNPAIGALHDAYYGPRVPMTIHERWRFNRQFIWADKIALTVGIVLTALVVIVTEAQPNYPGLTSFPWLWLYSVTVLPIWLFLRWLDIISYGAECRRLKYLEKTVPYH